MPVLRATRWTLLGILLSSAVAAAQTTQGLISGHVADSERGKAVAGALLTVRTLAAHTFSTSRSGPLGFFVLPLLPPGTYQIRVEAGGYQAQELHDLELPVGAFLDLNFQLRPSSDVWGQGRYRSVFLPGSRNVLTFFGPDVDSTHSSWVDPNSVRGGGLESTLSHVIDPAQVQELPFAGRDVYAILVAQPGVTADSGTSRGLGLAANGQRPASSNYLLDGLENNNFVSTGPVMPIAPEAVQEYRVSTSNFSAEYGRTSGFLANAVSQSGGSEWHGLGYFYWKNVLFNANDFQRNREGLPRSPLHESYAGFSGGGPVQRERLFASGSLEFFRSRSRGEPISLIFPTETFLQSLPAGSNARKLLQDFPPPLDTAGIVQPTVEAKIEPTVSLDRALAINRWDYDSPGSAHRWMARLQLAQLDRPDFAWHPYHGFNARLEQDTLGIGFGIVSNLRPNLVSEARWGWVSDDLHWDRPHPEIPTFSLGGSVQLPGTYLRSPYQNRQRHWEVVENLLWTQGRHVVKAGAGLLTRQIAGFFEINRDPAFSYTDLPSFAADRPLGMQLSLSLRDRPTLVLPDFAREYRNRQYFLFVQDSFRIHSSLTLNFGLRYENFGAPLNTGAIKDGLIELGAGESLPQRVASAKLVFPSGGDQQLYSTDSNNWAGRFGFSYALPGLRDTLLRGGWGIFYDRPFDNLWQNLRSNSLTMGSFSQPAVAINFYQPAAQLFPQFQVANFLTDFLAPVLYQPNLPDGIAQSVFLGTQHRTSQGMLLEVNYSGSQSRKLLATDRINRKGSLPVTTENFTTFRRYNPSFPDLAFRSSQGASSYHALQSSFSYRGEGTQIHLAYTWSHSIDNQSDPLLGDFGNIGSIGSSGQDLQPYASFSRQFDSRADRGSADFDQRHNVVLYSIWDVPDITSTSRLAGVFRDWTLSGLAAFRSGFPYSIFAGDTFSFQGVWVDNNRANLISSEHTDLDQETVEGGRLLLQRDAFQQPAPATLGNTGRNAFRGPGLWSIDLSFSRAFRWNRLGNSGRLTLRADVFNLFNHANLNNPDSVLASARFGAALYGRKGRSTGFPAATPLNEAARQIQFLFRMEF